MKKAICDCGAEVVVPMNEDGSYIVCNVECPKCDRHSTGGNTRSGEIHWWITAKESFDCQMEYSGL